MPTVLLCLCGCPKAEHLMGKKRCGHCGACSFFDWDGKVSMSLWPERQPAMTEDEADEPELVPHSTESTSAALRRVEQERDERAAHADDLATTLAMRDAELVSARTELEKLRKQQGRASEVLDCRERWICTTCGSRYSSKSYQDHPCGPLEPVTITITRGATDA